MIYIHIYIYFKLYISAQVMFLEVGVGGKGWSREGEIKNLISVMELFMIIHDIYMLVELLCIEIVCTCIHATLIKGYEPTKASILLYL